MIYGLNFGGPVIPDTPRSAFRKFPKRILVQTCEANPKHRERAVVAPAAPTCSKCASPLGKREPFLLVGIGQDEKERDLMLAVATNGHRRLHWLPVNTAGGTWYGIYAG